MGGETNPEPEYVIALRQIVAGARAADVESPSLEFKRQGRSRDDALRVIADAAACLANSSGGVIVVGVSDRERGMDALEGCDLDPEATRRRIHELVDPRLLTTVEPRTFEGISLLVVTVPESLDVHVDTRARARRRFGTACVPMDTEEQLRLREERRGVDHSAQPAPGGLRPSASALELARERLARLPDERRVLATGSNEDLLRGLGVVQPSGVLLNAGAWLFGDTRDQPVRIVYQYKPTPGGEPVATERLAAPLLIAFDRLLQLVAARRAVTILSLPTGQQAELADFPELAVREAVANAVIHRHYRADGAVTVEHSPEVLVVTSPGPLVSGVTPENILTHRSKPRNPLLAQAFRTLGLAEEVGRGVDRMYREMIRSGKPLPTIVSTPDSVRVSLAGGAANTHIARYVAQLPPDEQNDTDTLLVLFHLCERRTVNARSIASVLQKSVEEAEIALRRLTAPPAVMLEPTRRSARSHHPDYRLRGDALRALGPAARYQRRTADETDRKVIDHIREYGRITNRTVRNLLDVDVYRASQILGDLAQRNVITKTSEHERGPGVTYGPGPKFPRLRQRREHTRRRDAGI